MIAAGKRIDKIRKGKIFNSVLNKILKIVAAKFSSLVHPCFRASTISSKFLLSCTFFRVPSFLVAPKNEDCARTVSMICPTSKGESLELILSGIKFAPRSEE